MKNRLQKIFEEKTFPQKNRRESEDYLGGRTFMWIAEKNLTENDRLGCGLMEFILSYGNLNATYLQVRRTRGREVFDKMEVESIKDYLIANKDELTMFILRGQ
ncbi:hypothetical protein [Algoriphagus resistens]|uniref:hypothetical protein n=1 Tax=Algoriphagus resistens TaxID=1750590 RepID=UPI0007168383|nr:hypothetical protein [Algoriphagus resistens]